MAVSAATKKMQACEEIIGYTFIDKNRLWEALQMQGSGVTRIGDRRVLEGNKSIAIVGDAVLSLVLSEEWHERGEMRKEMAFRSIILC
jgi:ribonuclease III